MKTTIDTTTPATWAASVITLIAEATTDGFGLCDDGEPYDLHNFMCDTWGGSMPWNQAKHEAVIAAMEVHPDFKAVMAAFKAKHGADFMDDEAGGECLLPNA